MKHLIAAFRANAESAERMEREASNGDHARGYYYGQALAYADAASKLQAATDALKGDLQGLKTSVDYLQDALK
jgi:hypothetical protein